MDEMLEMPKRQINQARVNQYLRLLEIASRSEEDLNAIKRILSEASQRDATNVDAPEALRLFEAERTAKLSCQKSQAAG